MAIEVDGQKIERKKEARRVKAELPRWLANRLNKKEHTGRYSLRYSDEITKEVLPGWGLIALGVVAILGLLLVMASVMTTAAEVPEGGHPEGTLPDLLYELFPIGAVMFGACALLLVVVAGLGTRVATVYSFTGGIKIEAENMEYLESIREALAGSKWEKYDVELTLE